MEGVTKHPHPNPGSWHKAHLYVSHQAERGSVTYRHLQWSRGAAGGQRGDGGSLGTASICLDSCQQQGICLDEVGLQQHLKGQGGVCGAAIQPNVPYNCPPALGLPAPAGSGVTRAGWWQRGRVPGAAAVPRSARGQAVPRAGLAVGWAGGSAQPPQAAQLNMEQKAALQDPQTDPPTHNSHTPNSPQILTREAVLALEAHHGLGAELPRGCGDEAGGQHYAGLGLAAGHGHRFLLHPWCCWGSRGW